MTPVEIVRGAGPVVLALPHTGTELPPAVRARLNRHGLTLGDTDWHVERLYAGLAPEATTVRATFHRYVMDANRDPTGKSLYPGRNTTDLVPLTDFDARPLWLDPPDSLAIGQYLRDCHAPYHAALAQELERVRLRHGVALLYDCHSIRSVVPNLFEGTLPDFNIGTDGTRTCAAAIERAVERVCRDAAGYSTVVNGRFKGGWTVRHHGRPGHGVHAVQMELAQATHLVTETPPFTYDEAKAERLRATLRVILDSLAALAPTLAATAAAAAPAHPESAR